MTGPQKQIDPIFGVLPGVVLFIVIGILMLALLGEPEQVEVEEPQAVAEATEEATEEPAATEAVVEATEEPVETEEPAGTGGADFDPALVSTGENLFAGTCSACHGFDATGIPGLGKNLIESEFMDGLDEESFIEFVNVGRQAFDPLNTTGVAMPPKGGNPALTDEDISAIWAYLSSVRGAGGAAAAGEPAATEAVAETTEEPVETEAVVEETEEPVETEAVVEATEEAAAGEELDPAMVSAGEMVFAGTCSACHGPDATGIPGLGKNLIESEFMDGLDEESFIEFVNVGRQAFDPLNTTGVAMPPKGGNPALTDEDIANVWAYLGSLRDAGGTAAAEEPAATEEVVETEEPAATEEVAETEAAETETAVVREVDVKEVYNLSCAGCHGLVGEGVEGYGPALDMDMSADDLYAFLTEEVPIDEVDITEEFPHPPAAAPFTLTEEQLQDLVDYVLSLGG